MLDYEDVKRRKLSLMMSDPNFITGRARLESVEFHVHEFVYRKGVEDGMKVAGLSDAEIKRLISMV